MTERTIYDLPSLSWGDIVFVEERMKSIIDVTLTMQQSLHGCLHIEPKNKRTSLYAPYIYWMNFPISPWCENCGNGWWLHNFLRALKLQLPRTASTSNDMMPFSLYGSYKKKGIFSCASNFSVKGHLMCSICWYMSRHQAKKSVRWRGNLKKIFSPKESASYFFISIPNCPSGT